MAVTIRQMTYAQAINEAMRLEMAATRALF